MSEVAPQDLSHDSISRWLSETKTQPKDVWNAAKREILETQGCLIADETVLTKSRSKKIELVHPQYSRAEHGITNGIGLLNFLWIREDGLVSPIDFRIWEPEEDGKTKNVESAKLVQLM